VILVDTSIWVQHFRAAHPRLQGLLGDGSVLCHPFIIGELALGHLPRRRTTLSDLNDLPRALAARDSEVLHFVESNALAASGIGYVDAHLLAATSITAGARLWTRDVRLLAVAGRLGLADPASPS